MKLVLNVYWIKKDTCYGCKFLNDTGGNTAFCKLFETKRSLETELKVDSSNDQVLRCKACLKAESDALPLKRKP